MVDVFHGRQAVLMVRWYKVAWRDCGHPCRGIKQVALRNLIPFQAHIQLRVAII